MAKYINGNKTNRDLIAVCEEAWEQRLAGKIPVVNGVTFENATKLGRCQQHVREAVEATAYGREWAWPEASCCATATHQKLAKSGYQIIKDLTSAQSGDLVYMTPCGSRCGTCGQDAGHTGILHRLRDESWMMWQNTSAGGAGLCVREISSSEVKRIVGIYRLFPLAANTMTTPGGERPINWHGHYLHPEDVIFHDGAHYVAVRAAAKAEGSMVKVDPKTGKVFVGPASWWDGK